jgi:hypothetical protein
MKSFWLLVPLVSIACSKSATPEPETSPPETAANSVCVEIATTCHEHEAFSAKTKECHDMGHSKETSEAQCQARRTECLDECKMAAERGHDGPPSEETHDQPEGEHKHEH